MFGPPWREDAESFFMELLLKERERGSIGILWWQIQRKMQSMFGREYKRAKLKNKFTHFRSKTYQFQHKFAITDFEWDPNTNTGIDVNGVWKAYFEEHPRKRDGLHKEGLANYFRLSKLFRLKSPYACTMEPSWKYLREKKIRQSIRSKILRKQQDRARLRYRRKLKRVLSELEMEARAIS